jgi:hypothetical protein
MPKVNNLYRRNRYTYMYAAAQWRIMVRMKIGKYKVGGMIAVMIVALNAICIIYFGKNSSYT